MKVSGSLSRLLAVGWLLGCSLQATGAEAVLRGQVLGLGGQALVATVELWQRESGSAWPSSPMSQASTDSSGSFELPFRPADEIHLTVQASGMVPMSYVWNGEGESSSGLRASDILELPPLEMAGDQGLLVTVRDTSGKGLEGARIVGQPLNGVALVGWAPATFTTLSGVDGTVEVPYNPDLFPQYPSPGRISSTSRPKNRPGFEIEVSYSGYRSLTVDLAPRKAHSGLVQLIALTKDRWAVGQLVDRAGEPIADAALELVADPESGVDDQEPQSAGGLILSAFDGYFEIPSVPDCGELELRVRALGFAERRLSCSNVISYAGDLDFGTVELARETALSGFVIDGQGNAIPGAQIHLAQDAPRGAHTRLPLRLSKSADAQGYFGFTGLAQGARYRLQVGAPHHTKRDLRDLEPPVDEPLKIVLEPAASVSGSVVDRSGQAVAGAMVRVLRKTATGGQQALGRSTDEWGRFARLPVAAGPFVVEADSPEHLPARVELRAAPGEQIEGLKIELVVGATLEGRLLLPDGSPAEGAMVWFVDSQARATGHSQRTAADGSFRWSGLAPGTADLRAHLEGWPSLRQTVEISASEQAVELWLEGGGRVAGQVTTREGAQIAGARLLLRAPATLVPLHSATSRPDGTFEFANVAPGAYRLQAQRQGFALYEEALPIEVEAAGLQGIDIQLVVGTTVLGSTLGLDATELRGVEVRLVGSRQSPVRLDRNGFFRLARVPEGEWVVEGFEPRSGRVARRAIRVATGQREVELDLVFEPLAGGDSPQQSSGPSFAQASEDPTVGGRDL